MTRGQVCQGGSIEQAVEVWLLGYVIAYPSELPTTLYHRSNAVNASACRATRTNGNPCKATATASGLCCFHDPELQKPMADARRKGGANRSNARRAAKHIPADMKALASQLMEAITECYHGELEPRRLTAMGAAAGAIVRIHEVAEMEQRLEELERAAQTSKGWRA